jgi:Large eukaryotic DNA virus major capsid protein/Major capsid protein N-terminus
MTTDEATSNLSTSLFDLSAWDRIDEVLYKNPDVNKSNEHVQTLFMQGVPKYTWFTQTISSLKCEGQSKNPSYSLPKSVDYVRGAFARFQVPAVRVKKSKQGEYEIAWCKNIGHNVLKEVQLKINDLKIEEYDSVFADLYLDSMISVGHVDNVNEMIGNREELTGFGEILPNAELEVPLYFSMMRDGKALPLAALTLSDVKIELRCHDDLSKMLRVRRRLQDGSYEYLQVCKINLDEIISVKCKKGLDLKTPEVWGNFCFVTKTERENLEDKKFTMIITQVQKYEGSCKKGASAHKFDLKFTNPSKYFLFCVKNATAEKYNNLSCYTTDADNEQDGEDPVKRVSMYYGQHTKFKNLPSSFFKTVYPLLCSNKSPEGKSCHLLPFSVDVNSSCPKGSLQCNKLNMTMEIDVSDKDVNRQSTKCEYQVEIRNVSINMITFEEGTASFNKL